MYICIYTFSIKKILIYLRKEIHLDQAEPSHVAANHNNPVCQGQVGVHSILRLSDIAWF